MGYLDVGVVLDEAVEVLHVLGHELVEGSQAYAAEATYGVDELVFEESSGGHRCHLGTPKLASMGTCGAMRL